MANTDFQFPSDTDAQAPAQQPAPPQEKFLFPSDEEQEDGGLSLGNIPWEKGANIALNAVSPLHRFGRMAADATGATDLAKESASNLVPSAIKFGKDTIAPFLDPVGTAESMKNLGHGVLQKTGVMEGDENIKYADALGEALSERYGGMENLRKTMATDPVGFLSDLSMVLSGGGALAARGPGLVSKVGAGTRSVGSAIDPINLAASGASKGAELVGAGAAKGIGNYLTHTGEEPIIEAARAGKEGGARNEAFKQNIRGEVPTGDVVDKTVNSYYHLVAERQAEYLKNEARLKSDNQVLDFNKIDKAILKGWDRSYNRSGTMVKDQAAFDVVNKLRDRVSEWKMLDPKTDHTPLGFDDLKQSLNDIVVEARKSGSSNAYAIANDVSKAIVETIESKSPLYAKMTRPYREMSDALDEVKRVFSLPVDQRGGPTVDTALRKLQSTMRNNVNTSYGHRREVVNLLMDTPGGKEILASLAGQAMQPIAARGLGKFAQQIAMEALVAFGIMHVGTGGISLAGAAAMAPFMAAHSPKVVGTVANKLGATARGLEKSAKYTKAAARAGYQVGRLEREVENRAMRNASRAGR